MNHESFITISVVFLQLSWLHDYVVEPIPAYFKPTNTHDDIMEPIPAYFKPTNTLQQLLVRPKDKVEKGKVVGPVYHITCDDCDATYVGET